MRYKACIAWVRVVAAAVCAIAFSAAAQTVSDAIDEAGKWVVHGDLGTLEVVAAADAPAGAEGDRAVRCTLDETQKGQVYLRTDSVPSDLTPYSRLRFRLHGGLEAGSVTTFTVIDTDWRHRQWPVALLRTRSQEARWTEFIVDLDAPVRDKGADVSKVQWLTWFVHSPGTGAGQRTFFLDGVRLEQRQAPIGATEQELDLEHNGVHAVFSQNRGVELVRFIAADGTVIPVTTGSMFRSPRQVSAETATIRLSHAPEQQVVQKRADGLTVEYVVGGFRQRNCFTWEKGCLRIDRRVTCLEAGDGVPGSLLHTLTFGAELAQLIYDRGAEASAADLPLPTTERLPGNWAAARLDAMQGGVAVIYPRYILPLPYVHGREWWLRDRLLGRSARIPLGTQFEYTIWLLPLGAGEGVERIETTAADICSRLTAAQSPLRAYFPPKYQRLTATGQTLRRLERCTVWQASAAAVVERDSTPPAAEADAVTLFAARGEVEPLHLVLHARGRLGRVVASCSDLTQGQRVISASNVRVRYPRFMHIRRTTEAEQQAAPEPEQARFVATIPDGDTYMLTDRFYGKDARTLGQVEDPLFDGPPDTLESGLNQPVWLTVTVPADAASGLYTGTISLAEQGAEIGRIPLQLQVWRFSVPRVTSLRTWYQLWRHGTAKEHWKEYYRNLAEHKVSGFGSMPAAPKLEWVDDRVSVDWTAYDEAASYLFDELGMRNAKLPYGKRGGGHKHVYPFIGLELGTPEFDAAFEDYLVQAREHLQEKGWLDGLDCYIFDEPDAERIEVISRTAPILRRALPEMRIFPACARNTSSLVGVLNAWCPPVAYFGTAVGDFSVANVAAGRARGDLYWWYNQEDNCIGAPIVTHRALLWASWQAGLTGYFVWTINNWGNKGMSWSTVFEIGEAMVIYPGKDGPVDSLRWEQTREGLEDYEYLLMLERAARAEATPEALRVEAQALLRQARGLMPDPRCQLAVDPQRLTGLRHEIGKLLDRVAAR